MKALRLGLLAVGAIVHPAAAQHVSVVTTLTTYASIATEIVGDRGTVTAIARGDEDPHFVQPKPSYVRLMRDADLFVTTGMDLELWVPALLDRAGNRDILPGGPGYVSASQGVALLEIPTSVDRSQGDIHIYGNPHLLPDPLNGILVARNITAGLIRVAPAAAPLFEERLADFERRVLVALIGPDLVDMITVETTLQLLGGNRLYAFIDETTYQGAPLRDRLGGWFAEAMAFRGQEMVCYHREWSYFSRRFGIPCVGYVEPKLGIPPTPGHVRDLIDLMRQRGVRAIFAANYYPHGQIDQVAERTEARAVVVPENTTGAPGVDSYFDLVDVWITALADAYR